MVEGVGRGSIQGRYRRPWSVQFGHWRIGGGGSTMSSRGAAAMACGGGVPVGLGADGRAEELRNVEKKLARGLVGGEDERRRGLHVEVA